MANTTTTLPHPPHPPHPYYPLEAEVAGFLANEYSVLKLLSLFASGCLVILSATNLVAQKVRPGIPASELATVMWFVLCKKPSCQGEEEHRGPCWLSEALADGAGIS